MKKLSNAIVYMTGKAGHDKEVVPVFDSKRLNMLLAVLENEQVFSGWVRKTSFKH